MKLKNIEKKWLLFGIATFVTFLGIGYTLIKGTRAMDDDVLLSDSPFDDSNFYECVVDTYNEKNDIKLSYSVLLTDEQFGSITSLNCSNRQITNVNGIEKLISLKNLSVSKNQLTELDLSNNLMLEKLFAHSNQLVMLNVSKNTLLKEINVYNNQLTELDLSNNLMLEKLSVFNNQLVGLDVSLNSSLTELSIQRNPFVANYYVYKGENFKLGENVLISSHLNWESPLWTSDDDNLARVEEGNVAKILDVGTVSIKGILSDKYELVNVLNIVEITSKKYVINELDNYIYVGLDDNVDTIKSNIELSNENLILDVNMDDNKVYVKFHENILKEFSLYRLTVDKYEVLDKDIIINEKIDYDDLFDNIIKFSSNNITYKLFDTDNNVIENKILNEMNLKLYCDDDLLDTYNVSNYYLNFDQRVVVDSENKILKNISVDTTISDMLEYIDTNGKVVVLDNNGNLVDTFVSRLGTGYRVKIILDDGDFTYTVSVLGDVNGDGIISDNDIFIISRHIINKNVITFMDYLFAADYDYNGTIDINDVIKLSKYVKDGGNNE